MTYTGGLLNLLNGKMGISAPLKSVPVMKLIKIHKPKSKEELVELIKYHYANNCECGVNSMGSVQDFGKNLYEAQISFWGENKFSLKECIQWEYDLFVVQSLKGGIIEAKAINKLKEILDGCEVAEAQGYLDEELRVDIIVKKFKNIVAGIQVKPNTFKLMRQEVITFNLNANKKMGLQVLYLFYDENENFVNFYELVEEIKKL